MLKFIATRRFNYIDTFGNGAVVIALWGGQYLYAVAALVVASVASYFAERRAGISL